MDHIGIDLHKRSSQICTLTAGYAPMYAQRTRKVKRDRRDARALAEACRLGAYRPAHRTSDSQRHVRTQVAVREALVHTRCMYISLVSALLRRECLQRPCTVPGVGPVTAATFVTSVEQVERFAGMHQLEAHLGLVPRELSSGERQCRGRTTRAGNGRARWLLVEAAWSILRYKKPETRALRLWADQIAARRGKFRAEVALPRRHPVRHAPRRHPLPAGAARRRL